MRRIAALIVLAPFLLTGCFGGGGTKSGGNAAEHVIVLRMENGVAPDPYAAEVSRLSGGSIQIDLTGPAHPGDPRYETEVIRDVRSGRAQLAWVGSRAWDLVGVRSFDALMAPFLIDSYPLEQKVLESPIGQQMLAGLRRLGLVGIGVFPGPMRVMLGVHKPFLKAGDFAGARVGIQASRVAEATFHALGATTVALAPEAKLTGLDGYEQQLGSIYGNEYFLSSRAVTANLVFWPRPLVVFTSRKFFASLSASQRSILLRAARAALPSYTEASASDDQGGVTGICRAGYGSKILLTSRTHLAGLRRASQPVYRQLERDRETRHFITDITAMREQGTPATPSCSTAASARRSAQAGAIDGVYRMTGTAQQLANLDHLPLAQEDPANYGDYVFVLNHKHFAFTQESKLACSWGYGTIAVKGHVMSLAFADGGSIGSTAANKPGEFFKFNWSAYRDTLTLTPVKGATSPNNFLINPWQRLSSTPSTKYFSKRCPLPKQALK
jgi:TRAP-type C4-dicarboxylate transport system substrate-binding protein